jgi:NADH-quinone oxidoreductase subunit N
MGIFLLSLIGIPPLVGFLGKLYLFYAIIEKGSAYYWYVVVGAVNVAIGAFYYLRVMKTMVVDEAQTPRPALVLPLGDRVSLLLLVGANLLPILFWGLIDGWARGAAVLYAGR